MERSLRSTGSPGGKARTSTTATRCIEDGVYFDMVDQTRFINHSCDPECRSSCHLMRRRPARLCAAHRTSWNCPGASFGSVALAEDELSPALDGT